MVVGEKWLINQVTGGVCQEIGLVAFMFSLNFYFLMCPLQFPTMFPFLTDSQSLIPLSADYLRQQR